jgi:porphobilinogen deaminase
VPAPGQGVVAWVCNRDDLKSRQLLKNIHHPEVSACTNVERRVLQHVETELQSDFLGVYCEQDASGNYHVFAVCEAGGQLKRARLSSSTRLGLAEKLVQQLV